MRVYHLFGKEGMSLHVGHIELASTMWVVLSDLACLVYVIDRRREVAL
jgi:hypothetical protein